MARIQQEFYFGIVPKLVITDLTLINKTTKKHKKNLKKKIKKAMVKTLVSKPEFETQDLH